MIPRMNFKFLDLGNGDDREDLEEKKEPHAEPAEAPGQDR
jgi:hypothetical protein